LKVAAPSGTVTFLLTDVAGSTGMWEADAGAMTGALARHDEIVAEAVQRGNGVLIKARGEGDSTFAVFARATDSVVAALSLVSALSREPWPDIAHISVRAAVHTGEAEARDGDYYGPAVNRCARLRAIAHPGQVLLSHAVAELVRHQLPPGTTLVDLGVHRLRDLSAPEHVFQLCHPGLPSEFGPLFSLDALPHNLPVQLTSFVGREPEIAEVCRLVRGHRMVTLTGAAGCGKTRLALQVAAEMLGEVADGVWFVDLAAVADPPLVLPAVAQALGVVVAVPNLEPDAIERPRPVAELLADHVRPRELVVVLDNCEHLVRACGDVAEDLLRAGPGVRVLCTSREALGVGAETSWRVPSLAAPDPDRVPPVDELAGYESVRLFLERAEQRQPGFALTPQTAPAVAQICHRLDGIPLAIELAAARVRLLTPEQIAARLDDRFALLTGGSRAALERHQTLRAAVDWSYDALSEPERALLRRLSVFAGGCTLEAAQAVCTGGVVPEGGLLDLLGQLIDKSLLVMDARRHRARYRLLETIRQYGSEKLLSADEVEEQRARHRDFFMALAEGSTRKLWGPEQAEVMADLDDEVDNITQACEWCLTREDATSALRLGGAMDRYWSQRRPAQGLRILEEALRRGPTGPSFDRARALSVAGLLASEVGDFDGARAHLDQALEMYRGLGVRRGIVWSLLNLAQMDNAEGRLEEAAASVGEAVELARETDHAPSLGWALQISAVLELNRGRPELGAELAGEALELFRDAEESRGIAAALQSLGFARQRQGDYAGSVVFFEEASKTSYGSPMGLGDAALARGDLASARDHYEHFLEEARELGFASGQFAALIGLGEVALAEGLAKNAADRYAGAMALQRRGGPIASARIIAGIAKLAMTAGEAIEAARLLGAASSVADSVGLATPLVYRDAAEQCVDALRQSLGEQAFQAAWQEGRAWPAEEALERGRRHLVASGAARSSIGAAAQTSFGRLADRGR
jgi:predicted ATPase/class 3 adenylate cyclase